MQRNGLRAGFENAAKDRQRRFRDASPTISDRARSLLEQTFFLFRDSTTGKDCSGW